MEAQTEPREPERFEPLPRLLLRAYRAADEALAGALSRVGPHDVTPATWEVLAGLPPTGGRAVDLARTLGMTKQAVGQVLQELERAGLVERVTHPRDARSLLVRPTPRGRALAADGERAIRAVEGRWAAALGPPTLHGLRGALARLADVAADPAADGAAAEPGLPPG